MTLDEYLAGRRALVDGALEQAVPSERTHPETIHRAMRYSLFAGGKRVRPIVAMAVAEAVSDDTEGVERPALRARTGAHVLVDSRRPARA